MMNTIKTMATTAAAVVVLTGCGAAVAQDTAPSPTAGADLFDPVVAEATPIPGVELFEIESGQHTTDPVDYPQDPPAGGPHNPSWQKCAVYDAPLVAEHAVHSLEHGAVWITYAPDLPDANVEVLADLAAGNPYLLVSPYPDLEEPVVASAWGAQLRLEGVDDPRLQVFIDRYAGNGPERGASCASGVETTVDGG
jgi:hypothetical protein